MEDEKKIKLLENFLETLEIEGVCGFSIVDENLESPQVIILLDLDYIQDIPTKPGFVAGRIRQGVKEEIKRWIGLDVYVGSTAQRCTQEETKVVEMKQIEISDLIKETITEDSFVLQRKIHLLNDIINNFEKIDCDGKQTQSYERIYCNKMSNLSKDSVKKLKKSFEERLEKIIKTELRKNLKSK